MDEKDIAELAYKNGYEKGKPKWIPVSERLPDENTEVLTYRKGGISIELLHDGVWGDDDIEYAPYKVTHWMPLPEPPKGE